MRWYVLLVSTLFFASNAQALTYSVDRSAGSLQITGTITTNGTIGVLTTADITNIDLLITDTVSTFVVFPGFLSLTSVSGTALTATATALLFDYSDVSGDVTIGRDADNDGFFNAGWFLLGGIGDTLQIDFDDADPFVHPGVTETASLSGLNQIGAVVVPEPSAALLLGLGLVGLGAKRRRN